MKKNEFILLLLGVSYTTFKATKKLKNIGSIDEFKYNLHLNQSFDGSKDDLSSYYPEDNDKVFNKINEFEVTDILNRNESIPVWIDIYISESKNNIVVFDLLCSGRYSNDSNIYYYSLKGLGPFGIKILN